MTAAPVKTELPKLAITCTATNCEDNLHCFRSSKKLKEQGLAGACRDCHARLVDWPRVHERKLDDVEHTFTELRLELIRHHFWHVDIDERARNHALRKGRVALLGSAGNRVAKSVGVENPYRDGHRPRSRETSCITRSTRRRRAAGRASSTGTASQRVSRCQLTSRGIWWTS